MIQPNEFQAVAASLHRIVIRKYTDVAAFTYFLLEYLETVDAEVKYIWAERLSIVKVLFFGSRYIPFITVPLLLRFANGHLFTPERCSVVNGVILLLLSISTTCGDAIAFLRILALGKRKRGMGIYLTLHFTIVYVAYYTFFFIDLTRTVFGPSPLPDQVPCYLAQRDVRTMVIPFFLLLFNITSACLLSICLVLLNYRHSKSPFIKILYIDGTYHFVLMAATTTGNAALWLAASYEYRFLLLAAHQVVHSTLASRILLRMREVAHKDLEPTLDGSSDMRLTRITFAHTGSTRSTMTSYSSSAGHADKLDNIN